MWRFVAVALLAVAWGAGACETVLTAAEIAADRTRGVQFFGAADGAQLGYSASAAGDINNDGFDDFAVSAPYEGAASEGALYIVFGRSAAAWRSAHFDFSTADTPNPESWIRIRGNETNMHLGKRRIASGDFNGDGIGDLIIGSDIWAFVIFGRSASSWQSFSVTEIGSLAAPGFVVTGSVAGVHVGNAGDMNGDGIEDMLCSTSLKAYIVFGDAAGASRIAFDVRDVDGTNGFLLIDGTTTLGYFGVMGSAGDVDGDGLADLAIGSYFANNKTGSAFVLFARNVSASAQQWPASFNLLTDLDGANGFAITNPSSVDAHLGYAVVGAGDVNADGFADILVGSLSANLGAWVVFGHPAPWASIDFSTTSLDGSDGFHFASIVCFGNSGGNTGDVNGDGIDDVIIGAYCGSAAAVLFGRSGSWPAELERGDAIGTIGFQIGGASSLDRFGWVAQGAGDVNGDGLGDIIVGGPEHESSTKAGYAALVFGVNDHCAACSNSGDVCLVCDDGFFPNGAVCSSSLQGTSSSSVRQQGVSVAVIINFNETISNTTELEEEIASVLGIDAGLVSVVVISPTEVEVTIIGSEETAQRLVDIINGGAGSDGSGLGLLRKATDAHIRKDTNGSSDDGVDAAFALQLPKVLLFLLLCVVPH